MGLKEHIPRMYHRRLLLLCGVTFALMLPLLTQMARLAIVQGAELREQAQRRLLTDRWIGNIRGKILDRHGRVLAADEPTYNIAVAYENITGEWSFDQAYRLSRQRNAQRWKELAPEEQIAVAIELAPIYDARTNALWRTIADLGGVDVEVIEERVNDIRGDVQALAAHVWEQQRLRRVQRLAEELDIDETEANSRISTADVRRRIREEEQAHIILRGVNDDIAFKFLRIQQAARTIEQQGDIERADPAVGIVVIDAGERTYPFETMQVLVDRASFPGMLRQDKPTQVEVRGVATHVIGWMRDRIWAEDQTRREEEHKRRHGTDTYVTRDDLGRYPPTGRVGAWGIESAEEYDLRGLRGRETRHLDTGEIEMIEKVDGRDARLTIDIELQAYLQALFDPSLGLAVVQPWNEQALDEEGNRRPGVPVLGDPLAGAAVAIDIDSGDILALVTTPSFTREELRDEPERVFGELSLRLARNRAIDVAYAPGSIVKPLMLCAAVNDGKYSMGERIRCTGHFFENQPDVLRCWIYKRYNMTHSDQLGRDLDGADAIMASCNIFFYEIGQRLGPQRIVDWYRNFGVGTNPDGSRAIGVDLGIGPQFDGVCGRLMNGTRLPPSLAEARQMAIGQGPVVWTPLHAANAYAALGRAGVSMPPRLRMGDRTTRDITDLALVPSSVDAALSGLSEAVENEGGTTNHISLVGYDGVARPEAIFNEPGVTVWAKSGTADAAALVEAVDGERRVIRDGDHSWCVLLAAPAGDRPRVAISVLVEYGGSGGRTASPIANQVVHALVKFGYIRPKTDG